MTAKQSKLVGIYGVDLALQAGELARRGEGCGTVSAVLGVHWKTASSLMDIGALILLAASKGGAK